MAQLPGIGKRTALRLVLHLLKQPSEQTHFLSNALTTMREEIKFCVSCHNISDVEVCEICKNAKRNHKIICVVEDVRDVMAIENTNQFKGIYHVLGGKISPIDGVGPSQLNINSLVEKEKLDEIRKQKMIKMVEDMLTKKSSNNSDVVKDKGISKILLKNIQSIKKIADKEGISINMLIKALKSNE